MNDSEKILHALQTLQADVTAMKGDITAIKTVQQEQGKDIKNLDKKIETVDLKVAAVHEYQKTAHNQIVEMIYEGFEAEGKEAKRLEKRIDELEKRIEQLEQENGFHRPQ
jgi:predicted nuclease with TOPRIM domain